MLAAHADAEIAMSVNYIDDNGFIYVRRMGGVDAAITKAQRITIHTRKGPINGVVGNVAPHLTRQEGDPKPPKIHDLFLDHRRSQQGRKPKGSLPSATPSPSSTNLNCCAATWPSPAPSTTASAPLPWPKRCGCSKNPR